MEEIVPCSRYHSRIFLKGLKKTTESAGGHNQFPSLDSKQTSPEYKPKLLLLLLIYYYYYSILSIDRQIICPLATFAYCNL
jgi:hypothetical protein